MLFCLYALLMCTCCGACNLFAELGLLKSCPAKAEGLIVVVRILASRLPTLISCSPSIAGDGPCWLDGDETGVGRAVVGGA